MNSGFLLNRRWGDYSWPSSRVIILSGLICIALMNGVFTPSLHAEKEGVQRVLYVPGWRAVTGESVSPSEAREVLFRRGEVKGARDSVSKSETEATADITELVNALEGDPFLLFDFVHNYIDYRPFFGSANGATATLLARRGNDCDQASLFITLMREAGYTADYVIGDVVYSMERLANWTGVDEEMDAVWKVLTNGGIPTTANPPTEEFMITRVWVQANIGGTDYIFDPAMKEYEYESGIDLESALGYDRETFLTSALEGSSSGQDYVRDVNEPNVQSGMYDMSAALQAYIETNMPEASLSEVVSGRRTIPEELTQYPTTLPFAVSVIDETVYSELPQEYRHTMQIDHLGISQLFNTYEISGKTMNIFYSGAGNAPELYLEGELISTGNPSTPGERYDLTITADHPYAAYGGTYADATGTYSLRSGGSFAIFSDWESVSQELLDKHGSELNALFQAGYDPESQSILGKTLMDVGLNYLLEESRFADILGSAADVVFVTHHTIGVVGQEDGYFIDMQMGNFSASSVHYDQVRKRQATRARIMMSSAFEHGILEQKQDSSNPAVSTVKLLQMNNQAGDRTFSADSDNWASIQPELINYLPGTISIIENYISQGWTIVLPEDGGMVLNDWQGTGFISYYFDGSTLGMGMLISGLYNGSWGSQKGVMITRDTAIIALHLLRERQKWFHEHAGDPVDMYTGAFLHDTVDLSFGESEPMGLDFRRYYNSADVIRSTPLGPGWDHDYNMYMSECSNEAAGLGTRSAIEASAAIAAAYVLQDVLDDSTDIELWIVGDLIAKWNVDQLIDNAVVVELHNKTFMFCRLPDGSYYAPPTTGMRIVSDGPTKYVSEPFGTRYDFNELGRIEVWTDKNGIAASFSYNFDGYLETVEDCFGRTLEFTYDDGRLIQAEDFSGRVVQYEYTDGLLTRYTDAMMNHYEYQYNSESRLTSIVKPRGYALTINTYDDLGRVRTQKNAYDTVMRTFYFSGYRNMFEDDRGYQNITFYNREGNRTRVQDENGNSAYYEYNGSGQLTRLTDRNGGITEFTYDALTGKIASRTNAEQDTVEYVYETRSKKAAENSRDADVYYNLTSISYPDGTAEIFTHDENGNILTYTDRAGETTQFTYTIIGQRETRTNPSGGVTQYVYNADGTLGSETEPETGTVSYYYDIPGRRTMTVYPDMTDVQALYDDLDRRTKATDERGNTWQYYYGANGNLTLTSDPKSNTFIRAYDLMDRLQTYTNRRGGTTTFEYDAQDRLTRETGPDNVAIHYGYDPAGRLTSKMIDGEERTTEYDAEGAVISETTPLGHETQYETNAMGRVTKIIDPHADEMEYERDVMQRQTSSMDPLSRTTFYHYNGWDSLNSFDVPDIGSIYYERNNCGDVARITDANGKDWEFERSPFNRTTRYIDPLSNEWSYTYDGRGRMSTVTYPDGYEMTTLFDEAGNTVQRSYDTGLTLDYAYDADLNLLTDGDGIQFQYDEEGNFTRTVNHDGVGFDAEFSAGGRLETVSYVDGYFEVDYFYDNSSGLLTRTYDSLTGIQVYFDYDEAWRLTTIARANNVHTYFTFDAADRLTGIEHGTIADLQFQYDAAGQITRLEQTLPLDPADNLAGTTEDFTYDDASQVSAAGYIYDGQGRLTEDAGADSYGWDAGDRLTALNAVSLNYNGLDNLNERTEGIETKEYYYNYGIEREPAAAEKDASGWLRYYVYTPEGRLIYMIDAQDGFSAYFYHFDQVGNTLCLTDQSGDVTDAYAYSPYGKLLAHTGTSDQPFTFAGEWGVRRESACDNFYQMRNRYYDALTARFISRDPLSPREGDPYGVNPYHYANQNPLKFTDPDGLSPTDMLNQPNDYLARAYEFQRAIEQLERMIDMWPMIQGKYQTLNLTGGGNPWTGWDIAEWAQKGAQAGYYGARGVNILSKIMGGAGLHPAVAAVLITVQNAIGYGRYFLAPSNTLVTADEMKEHKRMCEHVARQSELIESYAAIESSDEQPVFDSETGELVEKPPSAPAGFRR